MITYTKVGLREGQTFPLIVASPTSLPIYSFGSQLTLRNAGGP